jgi:hypothetical protein
MLVLFLVSCRENPVGIRFQEPTLPAMLDAYSTEGSVALYWDARLYTDPIDYGFPEIQFIRITAAGRLEGAGWVVYDGPNTGIDSVTVAHLHNGDTYYFRMTCYDSARTLIGASEPIMAVPGTPLAVDATIAAEQRTPLRWSNNLAWSPDGNSIAFIRLETWPEAQLYRYDLSGSLEQLTSLEGDEYYVGDVSWSSDNLYFTYSPTRTAGWIDYRIWQLSLEDGARVTISSGPVDFGATRISDTEIVYCRGTRGPPNIPQLHRQKIGETQSSPLTTGAMRKYDPAFSQTRGAVAFSGQVPAGQSLFMLHMNTGGIEQLADNPYWEDIQPHWSPDGRRLYFASDRSGHFEIWVLDTDTGAIDQLTRAPAGHEQYNPRVDPTGSRIAYMTEEHVRKDMLQISTLPHR